MLTYILNILVRYSEMNFQFTKLNLKYNNIYIREMNYFLHIIMQSGSI